MKKDQKEHIKDFVQEFMDRHESGTLVLKQHGTPTYTAGASSINIGLFFEALLADYIETHGTEPMKGNWIDGDDVAVLAKTLDVAMNGKDAAEKPSLCDVISQAVEHFQQPVTYLVINNETGNIVSAIDGDKPIGVEETQEQVVEYLRKN